MDAFIGDKFVIRINGKYWSPDVGTRYFVNDLPNVMLSEADIAKLEKYKEPKKVKHICENCVYQNVNRECFPCSSCDKCEVERRDMFIAGEPLILNEDDWRL